MTDAIEVTKKVKKVKEIKPEVEVKEPALNVEEEPAKEAVNKEPIEVTPVLVKVFISKSVKCTIGKTEYTFEKDKKDGYMVSPDVRQVLRESGILKITY